MARADFCFSFIRNYLRPRGVMPVGLQNPLRKLIQSVALTSCLTGLGGRPCLHVDGFIKTNCSEFYGQTRPASGEAQPGQIVRVELAWECLRLPYMSIYAVFWFLFWDSLTCTAPRTSTAATTERRWGDELDAAFNCDCDCDCSCNYDCGSGCGFGCGCLWCLGFVCAAKYATAAGFVHGSQQMN